MNASGKTRLSPDTNVSGVLFMIARGEYRASCARCRLPIGSSALPETKNQVSDLRVIRWDEKAGLMGRT